MSHMTQQVRSQGRGLHARSRRYIWVGRLAGQSEGGSYESYDSASKEPGEGAACEEP